MYNYPPPPETANKYSESKNIYFVTWLRACAAIMIFLCHIFSYGSVRFGFVSQFLNIGVNMFFLLSGFLFGLKGNQDIKPLKWYFKRIKRIYIPYEMFLIILAIIYVILGKSFIPFKWGITVLGMQGFKAVEGASHAWYITAMLICYAVTPLISKIYKLVENKSKILKRTIIIILFIVPIGLGLLSDSSAIFIAPTIWYTLAYIAGRNYDNINVTLKASIGCFILMCLMFGLRIISKFIMDGTIYYNNIIVSYTQYIASFCIMALFAYLFSKRKPSKIVKFINDVSFEIYLYHCLFIAGPLILIGRNNIIVDTIIIAVITIVVSYVMNKIYKILLRMIEKR